MSDVNEQTQGGVEETPAAPVPGTPEYDQAMAEKYQSAHAKPEEEEPAPAPEETPSEEPKEGQEEDNKPSLKIEKEGEESDDKPSEKESEDKSDEEEDTPVALSAELFESASSEFQEKGELSEETIESFVSKGIPREFVATYVEGARALQSQLISEAQGLVGGEDNWNSMMEWAASLPESDVEAFNEAVVNPKTSALAIQGLYSRFTTENGNEAPSASSGAERGATQGEVYNSKQELTADIRDPRYAKDAAFRAGVEAKIKRSRGAGTIGPLGTAY